MKKTGLKTSYSTYNNVQLDFKVKHIIECLTDNSNFPVLIPPLEDLVTLSNSYYIALNKAKTGDREQIAIKNTLKSNLLKTLQNMAIYINAIAFDEKSKLVTSGFDLVTNGAPPLPITAPKNLILTDGPNKGEIKLSFTGATNAKSYIHQYSLDELPNESAIWHSFPSTSKSHIFKPLPSGQRVYIRTKVIGSKNREIMSEIVSRITQ